MALILRIIIIIYPPTIGMPYTLTLTLPKLPCLHDRRDHINRQFFRSISSCCISSLLPIPRNHDELLPDCELHLSIHARLHARNDTHLSSTILYCIISNRCHLRFWMFYYFVCYSIFHVLHIFILLFFYFFLLKSSGFITCYLNNKLTYLLTYLLTLRKSD